MNENDQIMLDFVLENPEYLEWAAEDPEKLSGTLAYKLFEVDWHARELGGAAGEALQHDVANLKLKLQSHAQRIVRRYWRS